MNKLTKINIILENEDSIQLNTEDDYKILIFDIKENVFVDKGNIFIIKECKDFILLLKPSIYTKKYVNISNKESTDTIENRLKCQDIILIEFFYDNNSEPFSVNIDWNSINDYTNLNQSFAYYDEDNNKILAIRVNEKLTIKDYLKEQKKL